MERKTQQNYYQQWHPVLFCCTIQRTRERRCLGPLTGPMRYVPGARSERSMVLCPAATRKVRIRLAVRLEQLVGIAVHLLAQVLVKDEAQDVVPKFIGAHLAPQGIGDVPESGVEVGGVIRHGRLKLRKEGIRNN